jgi:hypothetical protein
MFRAAAGGSLHDQAVIIAGRAVHAFLRSPARGGWLQGMTGWLRRAEQLGALVS